MAIKTKVAEIEFSYNHETGYFYATVKGQKIRRVIKQFRYGNKEYYYNRKGVVYFTQEQTEEFNKFKGRV